MAEETPQHEDFDTFSHDDVSVMRVLLQTVRGLSPISGAPALDFATDESDEVA